MNPISSAFGSQVQSTLQIKTTAPGAAATASQASDAHGDTVTLSEKGKALAKGVVDKDGDGATEAIKATAGQAVSAKTLTQNLQDAKIKQKSLKAKLEAEKLQEQSNPGSTDDIARLNAKLNEINTTVSKDQAKVYA